MVTHITDKSVWKSFVRSTCVRLCTSFVLKFVYKLCSVLISLRHSLCLTKYWHPWLCLDAANKTNSLCFHSDYYREMWKTTALPSMFVCQTVNRCKWELKKHQTTYAIVLVWGIIRASCVNFSFLYSVPPNLCRIVTLIVALYCTVMQKMDTHSSLYLLAWISFSAYCGHHVHLQVACAILKYLDLVSVLPQVSCKPSRKMIKK